MKKGRSSIITIIIVLAIIALMAYGVIRYIEKHKKEEEVEGPAYEYTNFQEEDFMQYEYEKIDSSLSGIYALAIENDYIVGVKAYNKTVNIYQINPELNYDYAYSNGLLYIVQIDTGAMTIFNLKTLSVEQDEIALKPNIEEIEVENNEVFFISQNEYYKYDGKNVELIYDNVSSSNFVIKADNTYICLDKVFYKIDKDGNMNKIDENVENIYYYDYYERDKIVYDKLIDEQATSKNIYNIYNENISNSIRNNTYFVVYGANEYIYTTQDDDVVLIKENGTNKYLYKSKEENINNISLFKDGYIIISTTKGETIIDLSSMNKLISDNIINLQKIKYLK